ncbi:glycosyltransferase family 39 protein [Candidatus Curtissbacteria bacterium]|nr:glycosyltransferase family 39 protein [Candidatus Curtissbacteria bacterium]
MKSFLNSKFVLVLIVLIAFVLRFYQLGVVPPHLNWDEASNGYNAYSILKTGRDEYGNFMPQTFKAFGDYNLALSVYTLVPSIAIFGLNQFAVRFPSALLGTLTILVTYLLALKIFQNKKIALLSAFLLAIDPWHLQFSRYDHEANFMVFWSILGVTTYLYGKRSQKGLVLTAAFFGLALNTYHGAKIWIPLILILLAVTNFKSLLKFRKKLILPVVVFLIFTIPIISNFQNSLIRGQSVGIFSKKDFLQTFISNYLSHYNLNFLFTNGDSIGRHSVSGMGELYVFELPLVLAGLVFLIHQKEKKWLLLLWFLTAAIPAALASPTPHALRALTFIPLYPMFASVGFYQITKIRNNYFKQAILTTLILIGSYNVATYLHLYYIHYPRQKALDWQDGFRQTMDYIKNIEGNYQTIAISNYYGHPYIFTLFYSQYPPDKYFGTKDGENGFDKYEFFGASWGKTKPGKALLVTPMWQSHAPKVLKNIYSTDGDLRYVISETE